MKTTKSVVFVFLMATILSACANSPERVAHPLISPVLNRILQRGMLTVGTTGKQPPLNSMDKQGNVIGLEADLARLMAGALGIKVSFLTMPFSDLLQALETDKVDMVISGMTITPERNSKVAFAGAYFVSGKSFVTKAQTITPLKDPAQINRPETILAVLKGSTSQIFVENVIPKAKCILAEDHQEALQLVLEGKAHAMIADHHVCILSVLLFPEQNLVTLEKPLTYEPFGIALPRNDPLLVNLVENFLGTLEGSGDLEKLRRRWFKEAVWGKETLRDAIQF